VTHRLEEFSLRGVVAIHQFRAWAGSVCDLCLRYGRGNAVPAACRQVEVLGAPTEVVSSDAQGAALAERGMVRSGAKPLLVDGSGRAVGMSTTVAAPGKDQPRRQRTLCLACMKRVTYEALTGPEPLRSHVFRYEKYDFTSREEMLGEKEMAGR
jgi:hypothetical protein